MANVPERVIHEAAALGLSLGPEVWAQLEAYLSRLLEENQSVNLTSVTDWEEAWSRHILDSLTLVAPLRAMDARRVIDVGAGGGLPGIPLQIVLPHLAMCLVDSRGKKAAFLSQVAQELGLTGVTVLAERAERVGAVGSPHRGAYDAVVARALAPLPVLVELTVPLLRESGRVFAIKGERAPEEILAARRALGELRAKVIDSHRTPTGTIVTIEKRGPTQAHFPRAPGTPKRSPL